MISRVTAKLNGQLIKPTSTTGNGGYGYAIQEKYDDLGIETSHTEGNDIPDMYLEIKSWDPSKKGHISVGSHKIDHVINTGGDCYLEKLQKWNLHKHNNGIVTHTVEVDFRNIKEEIKKEINDLVKNLDVNSKKKRTLCSSENFVIERCGTNSAKLRIKHSRVDNLIYRANSFETFNQLFGD